MLKLRLLRDAFSASKNVCMPLESSDKPSDNLCVPPSRTNILGVGVSAISFDQALSTLACWIEQREPHYVVVATVYTIMQAQNDERLRGLINRAGLITPDGMPL